MCWGPVGEICEVIAEIGADFRDDRKFGWICGGAEGEPEVQVRELVGWIDRDVAGCDVAVAVYSAVG